MTDRAEDLENWFTYHAPQPGQPGRYQEIRDSGHALAAVVVGHCPPGRERDQALLRIREAVMWANAGIACAQGQDAE